MVVIKSYFLLIFLFVFFTNSKSFSSQILDFETETFVKSLISDVINVNKINKQINFKIINDNNINAFVDKNNDIYITSGLIENCDDYVALLLVISHEIGHVELNHVKDRISNLNKTSKIYDISNLSIIAGSLISNNTEVLKGLALSSATVSAQNINFSKNQEMEADYYAIDTLKKLNLYSDSIKNLLLTIENELLNKGLTKDILRISTHPYFEERINIINYSNEFTSSVFDLNKNKKFNFIKAKFIGYNGNDLGLLNLEDTYRIYANSILNSKKGNLKKSLKDLNSLISNNKNNIFLIETKADILFSYGYINEAILFYKKVLLHFPDNYYAQIRIFENTQIDKLSMIEKKILFNENLNLLSKYYNNKNILQTYLELSKLTKKNEWVNFLNFWLFKDNDIMEIQKNLENYKKSSDKDLSNLVEIINNHYL